MYPESPVRLFFDCDRPSCEVVLTLQASGAPLCDLFDCAKPGPQNFTIARAHLTYPDGNTEEHRITARTDDLLQYEARLEIHDRTGEGDYQLIVENTTDVPLDLTISAEINEIEPDLVGLFARSRVGNQYTSDVELVPPFEPVIVEPEVVAVWLDGTEEDVTDFVEWELDTWHARAEMLEPGVFKVWDDPPGSVTISARFTHGDQRGEAEQTVIVRELL